MFDVRRSIFSLFRQAEFHISTAAGWVPSLVTDQVIFIPGVCTKNLSESRLSLF
jgi:hypothetical protein